MKNCLPKYEEQGQSLIVVLGHYGNWELVGAAYAMLPYHKLYVIYHPLKNQYFERLMVHMRTRLGNGLYPMKKSSQIMRSNQDELTITAFIADQTPRPERGYWMEFLNQDTPVFRGTSKMAKELNYPVLYISIQRPKRGQYELHAELLVDKDTNMTEDEITELHTRRLEKDIRSQAEIWLWTHRRWKHGEAPIAIDPKILKIKFVQRCRWTILITLYQYSAILELNLSL